MGTTLLNTTEKSTVALWGREWAIDAGYVRSGRGWGDHPVRCSTWWKWLPSYLLERKPHRELLVRQSATEQSWRHLLAPCASSYKAVTMCKTHVPSQHSRVQSQCVCRPSAIHPQRKNARWCPLCVQGVIWCCAWCSTQRWNCFDPARPTVTQMDCFVRGEVLCCRQIQNISINNGFSPDSDVFFAHFLTCKSVGNQKKSEKSNKIKKS